MNFSYGIIAIVGVLAAISIGFVAMDPDGIIEPRVVVMAEEKSGACTLQWNPVCGVDGVTFGNMCMLNAADVKLDYPGACIDTEPTSTTVLIPAGSGVPGCEETDECFLPFEITVSAGVTIFWTNDDSTVHTVTSNDTLDTGDVIFDSGIISPDSNYEFTFNDAGTFDYYCIVHPWMTGIVNVT